MTQSNQNDYIKSDDGHTQTKDDFYVISCSHLSVRDDIICPSMDGWEERED